MIVGEISSATGLPFDRHAHIKDRFANARRTDGNRERGPFATRLEAEQDLEIYDEETLEVGETLEEAEAELGIADWVDPETGEPAEDEVSRIEEH